MSKPIAVLISDVHYSLPTLELADKAMRMAVDKANSLDIPLIVAGDLHDTKANMRAECIAAITDALNTTKYTPYLIVGNHDKWNEKSGEFEHSLRFPSRYNPVTSSCNYKCIGGPDLFLIPYYSNSDELRAYLNTIPKESTLIMHQGLSNSNSGHYIQDKSAISKADVAGFRVISGHYHTRQTIKLPYGGTWDYIGNPYTLNYGEANDPPKGFQVLYDDGNLEFIPTNLRKHVVYETTVEELFQTEANVPPLVDNSKDLVWVKITGTREELKRLEKWDISEILEYTHFKLDLIPLESETSKSTAVNQTQPEILDSLIDSLTNTSHEQKERVKNLWRGI